MCRPGGVKRSLSKAKTRTDDQVPDVIEYLLNPPVFLNPNRPDLRKSKDKTPVEIRVLITLEILRGVKYQGYPLI